MTHTISNNILFEKQDSKRYQDASDILNIFCGEIEKRQGFMDTFIKWFVVNHSHLNSPDFLFILDNTKTFFSREIREKKGDDDLHHYLRINADIPEIYLECITIGKTDKLCIIMEYCINPVEMSEKEEIPIQYSVRYTPKHGTAYCEKGQANIMLEGSGELKEILLENTRKKETEKCEENIRKDTVK